MGACDLLILIDIDFGKRDFLRPRQLDGQLLVVGGDLLAWATPIRIDCKEMSVG